MTKTVLCYGDSNTWGYNPATKQRFGKTERWTGVMQQQLGQHYHVVEEGLNGRTTVWDDPVEGYKNGEYYLIPCLESHHPLDLVIIMLGTNDLKMRFSVPAADIAQGAGKLVRIVQHSEAGFNGSAPKVLLIAPPPVTVLTEFAEMFAGAEAKSTKFSAYYHQVAKDRGCYFFDAAQVIISSNIDGIHFEADQHQKLGKAIAEKVETILA